VLAIGVRGGRIKPSTGYAFSRVQADCEAIVQSLLDHGHPSALPASPAPYGWLDAVMLRVMRDHGELIAPAFATLFSRNPAARILRFLDEQASPLDVLAIMASLPVPLFVGTALELAVGQRGNVRERGMEAKGSKAEKGGVRPRKLRPA
jgi:lycopene beta-cyclase